MKKSMIKNIVNNAPEIVISGAMLLIMFLLSEIFNLPIVFPSGERAAFVGVHYIYPLIGVGFLGVVTFFVGNRETAFRFLIALPCYVAVLLAYFNIKLWIPHINPSDFDATYWAIDQLMRPVVDLCMSLRRSMTFLIPYDANFYMISYIALFYTSFLYHAIKTPDVFRNLILSALILQVLGTLSYLVAPAIGPFIYESGVSPMITEGQHSMLEFYRNSVALGPDYLAKHGSANFTVGLAAMPSLHSAGAYLFFLFAWKHGKALVPLYSFILIFILITAVASRWHYIVDIPIGMGLAWASYKLADWLAPPSKSNPAIAISATNEPLPA